MTVITNATVEVVVLPLVAPFTVSTRTAHEARNVLFRIYAEDGTVGIGIGAPVEYVTGETIDSVVGVLSSLSAAITDIPVDRISPLMDLAQGMAQDQPTARTALEMALFDLWAKHWNMPLWHYFGGAQKQLIADLTIPIVSTQAAEESARAAWDQGFRHLKVKVGDSMGMDADLERLAAIAAAVPRAALRIDANQAFTPDEAVKFIKKAVEVAPMTEMIEQPTAKEDTDGLIYVHSRCYGLPLFADESALTLEGVSKLIRLEAVDGINVKLMKSGIAGAWRIASLCHAHGIKLMIGCMLESRPSLSAACALAAGTGWFDFIDIDSHRLLAPTALFSGGFVEEGAILRPNQTAPGWGVELDEHAWNNRGENSVSS